MKKNINKLLNNDTYRILTYLKTLQNIITTVNANADLKLSMSPYKNQTLELSTFLKPYSAVSRNTAVD
jgi:hypothetical protein